MAQVEVRRSRKLYSRGESTDARIIREIQIASLCTCRVGEITTKLVMLIPSGCRQGVCGTCATRLLSGKVQMDAEEVLTDELRAEGFILPCVSRPLSDITLDA